MEECRRRTQWVPCSFYTMGRPMRTEVFTWVRGIDLVSGHLSDFKQCEGHALNKILKDIVNRYQVSRGRRVKYVHFLLHGIHVLESVEVTSLAGTATVFPSRTRP